MTVNSAAQIQTALDTLDKMRKKGETPPPGTAALAGKTKDINLISAFHALRNAGLPQLTHEGGVTVTLGSGSIYDVDSALAHEVEELFAVSQSLLLAYSRRQTSEELKNDYDNLMKQYAEILSEVGNITGEGPKKEAKKGGFFSGIGLKLFERKGKEEVEVTDEDCMKNLEKKIKAADELAQRLIKSSGHDLRQERAYHEARLHLQNSLDELDVKISGIKLEDYAHKFITDEQRNSDLYVKGVTATEFQFALQNVKENLSNARTIGTVGLNQISLAITGKTQLHKEHIGVLSHFKSFLTVIKISMVSAESIRAIQTMMESLGKARNAATGLMSTATVGLEKEVYSWQTSPAAKQALKDFAGTLNNISKESSNIMNALNDPKAGFEEWGLSAYRKILEPALADKEASATVNNTVVPTHRPIVRQEVLSGASVQNDNMADSINQSEEDDSLSFEEFVKAQAKASGVSEEATKQQEKEKEKEKEKIPEMPAKKAIPLAGWNPIQRMVVSKQVETYNATTGSSLTLENIENNNWNPEEVASKLRAPTNVLSTFEIQSMPAYARSELDFIVQRQSPEDYDWAYFAETLKSGVPFDENWSENFVKWMGKCKDDVDWTKMREWTELAFYLTYFDQDAQAKATLHSPEGESMRNSFKNEIVSFFRDPGVPDEMIKEWGFSGLIIRHGLSLGVDKEDLDKGWRFFGNPVRPIDWDGNPVSLWPTSFAEDMGPEQCAYLEGKIDETYPDIVKKDITPFTPPPLSVDNQRFTELSFSVGSLPSGDMGGRGSRNDDDGEYDNGPQYPQRRLRSL